MNYLELLETARITFKLEKFGIDDLDPKFKRRAHIFLNKIKQAENFIKMAEKSDKSEAVKQKQIDKLRNEIDQLEVDIFDCVAEGVAEYEESHAAPADNEPSDPPANDPVPPVPPIDPAANDPVPPVKKRKRFFRFKR